MESPVGIPTEASGMLYLLSLASIDSQLRLLTAVPPIGNGVYFTPVLSL